MFTHAAFRLFDTTYPAYRVFMLLTAIAMFAALLAVLTRTRVGLIIQAALTRPDMVAMLGHNVRKSSCRCSVPARWRLRSGNLGCLLFRAALPGNSRRRVPPLSSQRGLRGRDPQRRGGCLVVSVPGADERGASVFERVLDHANAELATMVDQAAITAEAAEAKLAAKLALGSGIENAAASLGVSRETARTQLKAVFAKTNTRRQAELAALVARFRS